MLPVLGVIVAMAMALPWALDFAESHELAALTDRLLAEGRLLADTLEWKAGAALDRQCDALAAVLGARVTVIAPDGQVLGESSRPSAGLERHDDRPEIEAALRDGTGSSIRQSGTVGARLLYVAFRQDRGPDRRVIRVAISPERLEESRQSLLRKLLVGLALAGVAGVLLAVLVARGMERRIGRAVAFADRLFAEGGRPYLGPERRDVVGQLEESLAGMAHVVDAELALLRVEHERLEAILRGMVEGVIVTDLDSNVALLNARARSLLGVPDGRDVRGQSLVGLIRDPALAEVSRELKEGTETVSRDITLGGVRRVLQLNAALLRREGGDAFGWVLVLHDVTELRRLEVVQRDFVANVSHELRTPLTAIKGYAETLLGEAGEDRETARRFLAIIDRHSERLGRLTADLLTLSDLELGRASLRMEPVDVAVVVDDVLQILHDRGARGGVTVNFDIAAGTPRVYADGDRLRQVLINLVDNALKFTPAGGRVTVGARPATAADRAGMVELSVADTGIGIPARDLPRLTERFFRVDKARSRDLGGTGLGLAIVQQIVQRHGGAVTIASTEGHGTAVHVYLPATGDARAIAQRVRGS